MSRMNTVIGTHMTFCRILLCIYDIYKQCEEIVRIIRTRPNQIGPSSNTCQSWIAIYWLARYVRNTYASSNEKFPNTSASSNYEKLFIPFIRSIFDQLFWWAILPREPIVFIKSLSTEYGLETKQRRNINNSPNPIRK